MTDIWTISLWEPWASLIADGVKTIETRSWEPPKKLRGQRIAIHAAKTHEGMRQITRATAPEIADYLVSLGDPILEKMGFGCVVATAVYRDAIPLGKTGILGARFGKTEIINRLQADHPYGDFSPGRFAWLLDDVQKLETPIPARGSQGFFRLDLPIPAVGS